MPKIIRSAKRMAGTSRKFHKQGKRIGVVPTLGALHEGHLSLIRAASAQNDIVIVTVFVNPLQFGPKEDFERYPRDLHKDGRLAAMAGADIIFAPSVKTMYPAGFQTSVEASRLAVRWEGNARPGHFRGVATVVTLLFQITQPTQAYFGQKDYQQALIIQRLIKDLRFPIRMHILPTVREADGLAMSSRNATLSPAQRSQAIVLSQALAYAHERIRRGERRVEPLIEGMRQILRESRDARIDYATVVDAKTLEPLWRLRGRVAILLAVWIGQTRLIDNLLVDVS